MNVRQAAAPDKDTCHRGLVKQVTALDSVPNLRVPGENLRFQWRARKGISVA